MASSYMTFTPSEAGTSHRTGTISAWLKRADVSSSQRFWGVRYAASHTCEVTMNEYIQIYANYASSEQINLRTTAKYADPGAWYHVVVGFDTTQSVEADRVKLYVNGVQNSTFSTYTNYPALNDDLLIGHGYPTSVGAMGAEGSNMWNGCISWAQYVDGLQLAPTEFGEFDSTSGIWKIKTDVYGTPGINGFCLKMEDRTNLDLDSSSNAHVFTTVGTPTATYDNPSNNFATFNPLTPTSAGQDLENGNLYCPGPNSPNYWQSVPATLGARAGKWYWEFKDENSWGGTGDSTRRYGICDLDTIVQTLSSGADARFSGSTSGYAYMNASGVRYNGGTISGTAANYPTFTDGDIIQVAMDLDNQKLYFGKNGTWLDSSDPTSGATGTGSVADISATATWSPYVEIHYGSDNVSANFGNGYFKTTSTGTTEADDAGIGQFKYDVPAGYYTLCTKNIKAYGG